MNEALANLRNCELVEGIARLSDHVTRALQALPLDSRFAQLAGERLPDAAARLDYVVKVTEHAAHKTLDLVEHSRRSLERLNRAVTDLAELQSETVRPTPHALGRVQDNVAFGAEQLRLNLSEMTRAQSCQDVTGQIIRRVVALIGEVEQALSELLGAAGVAPAANTSVAGSAVPGQDCAAVSQRDAGGPLS